MTEDLLTVASLSRPGTKSGRPKTSITLHWTEWPKASAKMVRDNWEFKKTLEILQDAQGQYANINGKRVPLANLFGSAHIAIDDRTDLLCVPLDEDAFHTGITIGNQTSIGIELCVLNTLGQMSQAVLERARRLVAELCREYNIPTNKIVRHFDWSNKRCPKWFVDHPDEFEQFKKDVKDLLRPA